jgi:AbrB family looped-hinge helix DNA binding protein
MAALTVSSKGWVVIPVELREKYKLHPGARVQIVDYGGVLAIVPAMEDPIAQARGILKGPKSLTALLIAEHQAEVDDEHR